MKRIAFALALMLALAIGAIGYQAVPHSTTVVAQLQFTNQNTTLGPTVLWTSTNTNDYRVSGYVNDISSPCINVGGVFIFYTDAVGAQVVSTVQGSGCPPEPAQGSVVIHAVAGSTISYEIVDGSGDSYNAYLILERL